MRETMKKLFFMVCCVLCAGAASLLVASETLPVERFALYVASSTGGSETEKLRYANTDAYNVASTMNEIGGIKAANSNILVDPKKREIDNAIKSLTKKISSSKSVSRRTEFVFYYSGHSDEENLLLGNERYAYTDLKETLNKVNADVQVVMLDSCYSGNFVRTKGGSREKPFLFDDSTVLKGHAYLTSSSESEASQEADSIQSSYFTHALVMGMRGAADTSGDGKVSLNELYQYAFNETLSRTEFSKAGPQHPSYNITLVGSGDFVLTDVSLSDSALIFDKALEGTYFVRNSSNYLVAQINKIAGTEISLALPAGVYSISMVTSTASAQMTITLQQGEHLLLDGSGLVQTFKTETRSRGTDSATTSVSRVSQGKDISFGLFDIGLWPGANITIPFSSQDVFFSLNLFAAGNRNVRGLQTSLFYNNIKESLHGVQLSSLVNNVKKDMMGVQTAGLVNVVGGTAGGVQTAGLVNVVRGDAFGVQTAGLVNTVGGTAGGVQSAGLVNVVRGDTFGVQSAGLVNAVSGNMIGIQSAGLVNTVKGTAGGVQIAGLVNVADTVNGVQIGLINVAKKVNGVSFGLLNFISDGILSPAVFIDSNKDLFVQYQGGNNLFYTVFYAGTPVDFSLDHLTVAAGVGFRLQIGFLSLDLDVSGKTFYTFSDEVKIVNSKEELSSGWMTTIPSLRASLNIAFSKHFSVFGGAVFDMDLYGGMPDFAHSANAFGTYPFTMHPSFFVGLKF